MTPWMLLRRLAPILLAIITVSVYARVFQNDFVDFDDNIYVSQNEQTRSGISPGAFIYAWTTFDSGNWIPFTWLSYQLDTSLLGFRAASYQFTNLALHTLNVLLLYFWLSKVTGCSGRSFFVACLFAVHPLHVESVAWIAERKDVLSTFWLLVTLMAYQRYVARSNALRYLIVIAAFLSGLLSKSMVVTLPVLLLILDFWPLNRLQFPPLAEGQPTDGSTRTVRSLIVEKLPLFSLSLIIGIVTIFAQDSSYAVGNQTVGAAIGKLPLPLRIANATVAYWWYITKTVWPTGLCVFYPHPQNQLNTTDVAMAAFGLALVTLGIVIGSVRRPHLVSGGLWFAISLLPVIGLLQVGSQAYADRYSYIPHIGLFIAVVWEIQAWLEDRPITRVVGLVASSLVLFVLGITTIRQVTVWRSTETLWSQALTVDPGNWFAHLQAGNRRVMNGQLDEIAIDHLKSVLEVRPGSPHALNNIGWIYQSRGDLDQAISFYRQSLIAEPTFSQAARNLILAAKKQKQLGAHVDLIDAYIQRVPSDGWTINELGMIAVRQGQMEKAQSLFQRSLDADPNQRDARVNLALTLSQLGQNESARSQLETVLAKFPGDANSHVNLAMLLERLGDRDSARHHYAEAVRYNPNDREAIERLRALEANLIRP